MENMRFLAKEKNSAIIVSLHDLNLAAGYCDQVVMLKKGKIHSRGSPGEILNRDTIRSVYEVEAAVSRENERTYIIPLRPAEK